MATIAARRVFVIALKDVMPLDNDGHDSHFHVEECPAPCVRVETCKGTFVRFRQTPAADDMMARAVDRVARLMAEIAPSAPAPLRMKSIPGFETTVVVNVPHEPDVQEQFQKVFTLLQWCVDGLRNAAGPRAHIPSLTLERIWPVLEVLEVDEDGSWRTAPGPALDREPESAQARAADLWSQHGRLFGTPTPLSRDDLGLAQAYTIVSANGDPIAEIRHLDLGARQAGAEGDYFGAILKAAASAEILLKHTAATLCWETTTHGSGEQPVWVRRPRTFMSQPLHRGTFRVLGSALGGIWTGDGVPEALRDWRRGVADVRNSAVHSGHRPTGDQVAAALEALSGLQAHVSNHLARRAQDYPRTAVMLVGPRLNDRGAWGKVRATVASGDLHQWRQDYRTWVANDLSGA